VVDVFIDTLLSQTPEMGILKFFISRFRIPVQLPQSAVLHRTHSIIVDPWWPRGVATSPLGNPSSLLPCCFLSSLLISLPRQKLILKSPFRGKTKVPLANSRAATLITTRTGTIVTCERRWEKKHGVENTQVEKIARKNIEGN
jgi:hypothetical protein